MNIDTTMVAAGVMRRTFVSARLIWVVVPIAVVLAGCTTIRTVSGGAKAGEFYVMTTKNFLIFSSAPLVMRCTQRPTDARAFCDPVLTSAEAGEDQSFADEEFNSQDLERDD